MRHKALPRKKEEHHFVPFGSVAFSSILPVGNFRKLAGVGFGVTMDGGVKDFVVEKSIIHATVAFYYLTDRHEEIQSFMLLKIGVQGGYCFHLYDKFYITPIIGVGYLFHFLKEKSDNGNESQRKVYHDPSIDFHVEVAYRYKDSIEFIFSPGYLLFFETKNTGMALTISGGVRLLF